MRTDPAHVAWLDAEFDRLLGFAADVAWTPAGFPWLDADGRPEPDRGIATWITTRMTHVHALAHLRGRPGAREHVAHGVAALRGPLRDATNGGWYGGLAADGTPVAGKAAYDHAFVLLAASSATAAGVAEAPALLEEAIGVVDTRFWDPDAGRCRESFADDWSACEPYRGANANMHLVEAFLAVGDVTGDARWHDRALSIATHLIDGAARNNGWRLPEHFDADWRPLLDHNREEPAHPFRPYGSTIGHWLEWARLLLHLEATLPTPPAWLLPAARTLFDAAVAVGWHADGTDGFVYTVDWDDRPVVRARMHWVLAEAIAAAAALHVRTGDATYDDRYAAWWDHARTVFLDVDRGSWHHELTPGLAPATVGTWTGKPDLYHAVQATLLPRLDLAPALAPQLARRDG